MSVGGGDGAAVAPADGEGGVGGVDLTQLNTSASPDNIARHEDN